MNTDTTSHEIDGPYWISVKALARHVDPFKDDVWGDGPINIQDVKEAIMRGDFAEVPDYQTNEARNDAQPEICKAYDVMRVAYMVVNPQDQPIEIDVAQDGSVSMDDGCHRLASAIYRQDTHISAHYSGYLNVFRKIFGRTMLKQDAEHLILKF